MSLLKKTQKLPLRTRKVLLFTVVFVIGIVLIWIWVKVFFQGFKGLQGGQMGEIFKIPSLKENIQKDLPKIDFPDPGDPESLELEI